MFEEREPYKMQVAPNIEIVERRRADAIALLAKADRWAIMCGNLEDGWQGENFGPSDENTAAMLSVLCAHMKDAGMPSQLVGMAALLRDMFTDYVGIGAETNIHESCKYPAPQPEEGE